jgi:hypothetical protein
VRKTSVLVTLDPPGVAPGSGKQFQTDSTRLVDSWFSMLGS